MRVSKRGFTLIEMTVSIGIAGLIGIASVALVTTVAQQKKRGADMVKLQTRGAIGASQLFSDLDTAGFRLPSAAWALRVYDNLRFDSAGNVMATSALAAYDPSWATGSTDVCAAAGSTYKLKPGEDAIEIWRGDAIPTTISTNIGNRLIGGGPIDPINFTNVVFTAAGSPFNVGDVLLIAGDGTGGAQERCLVQVDSAGSPYSFHLIDQDLQPISAYAYAPNDLAAGKNCVRAGARVYRAERRSRYFVCEDSNATPPLRGATLLMSQVGNRLAADGGLYLYETAVPVQPGIESLQIGVGVVYERGAPTSTYWPAVQTAIAFEPELIDWSSVGPMISAPPPSWATAAFTAQNFEDFPATGPWHTRLFKCFTKRVLNAQCLLWNYPDSSFTGVWKAQPATPNQGLSSGTISPSSYGMNWGAGGLLFTPTMPVEKMTPRERVRGLRIELVTRSELPDSDEHEFFFGLNHPTAWSTPLDPAGTKYTQGPTTQPADTVDVASGPRSSVIDKYKRQSLIKNVKFTNFAEVDP